VIEHDLLIVGGGLAGPRAAVETCASLDVGLISRVHPLRSHSLAAQGGINASLGNHPEGRDDSAERHAFDTVKGSDYLADQDAVRLMCENAPRILFEMERWGTPFSRFADGRIAQRPFGGGRPPRRGTLRVLVPAGRHRAANSSSARDSRDGSGRVAPFTGTLAGGRGR